MIPENQIVTKKYLEKALKDQKLEIIREVRIMMHETMQSGMENMKLFYDAQSKHYMTALLEGFRDEMRVYKDEFIAWRDKINNHEDRITTLEEHRV